MMKPVCANKRKYGTFAMALTTLFLYTGIFYFFPENEVFRRLQKAYGAKYNNAEEVFRPVTLDGVFTFFNVCLEPLPVPSTVFMHQIRFTVTKRIVIYDRNQSRLGSHRLKIAGPGNYAWNYYDVYFTNESLPISNRTMSDNVPYFVSPRCPGNLFSFFEEVYLPLYSLIHLTNKFHPGSGNLVIYNTPKTNHNPFCRNLSTYNEIIGTLYTNGFHDVYYNVPSNTCFKNAVFGGKIKINNSRDVVNNIINQYNLSDTCVKKAEFITLIFRKQRRIINMEDLHRWVLKRGFKREFVRIVDFDNATIRKQIELACTSQVIIGLNGAALQWSIFMPEKSHLVEMSWRSFAFFYPRRLSKFGILHHSVELKDVRVNWTSYEYRVHNGGRVNDDERQRLLRSPPVELWRWSDGFVQEDEVNETLLVIFNSLFNS